MKSWNTRFTIVALMLASTGLFLHFLQARGARDIAPAALSLGSMPTQLGDWSGTDIPLAPATLRVLHGVRVLQRAYRNAKNSGSDVDLYVAYYPNQRAGDRRHLPDDCLPAAGWSTVQSGTINVALPGRQAFLANRYFIRRGSDRQVVLFWFWARGRGLASEEWADIHLIFDNLRFGRSDDALIRINSPILPEEGSQLAEERVLAFAAELGPLMDNYLPRLRGERAAHATTTLSGPTP